MHCTWFACTRGQEHGRKPTLKEGSVHTLCHHLHHRAVTLQVPAHCPSRRANNAVNCVNCVN